MSWQPTFFGYFCLVQQTKSNDNKSVLAKGLENFSYTRLLHIPHALSIIRCTEKSWNKSPQWAMCYVNSRSMIKQARKVSLLRIFWFIAGFLLSRIKKSSFLLCPLSVSFNCWTIKISSQCPSGNVFCLLKVISQFSISTNQKKN